MTSRRPSILNRSSTQTQTELPTQEEHISYDVCFCESCLNEARILEEEPLNKVRQSNKPKRSKQKYDAPPDTTPIEEVVATGWGDEFSDNEVTPGKLPQWDEQLAIQKQELESEWENPFAVKRGENHTILHLSMEENDDDDLPYLKFRNFKQMAAQIIKRHEEHAFPSSQFGYPQGKSKIFNGGYGEYYNSQWTLPLAWTESGVMLMLPADPGLWSEVISRWESITINRLNNQTWSDNKAKLAFVENLLGENEPQNITSQVRQLILLEDPYRGSTDEQDRAYRDLDRITYEDTKNLWSFLEDENYIARNF
ncbi:hypothetical protein Tco_1455378 [Tanacetum coccineum]